LTALLDRQQETIRLCANTPYRNQGSIKAPHWHHSELELGIAPRAVQTPERVLQVGGIQVSNQEDVRGQQLIL